MSMSPFSFSLNNHVAIAGGEEGIRELKNNVKKYNKD